MSGRNIVRRTISGSGTFTVPAGVTSLIVRKDVSTITLAQNSLVGGGDSSLTLKANGEAWSWGTSTGTGVVGDGTITTRNSPVQVVGGHSFTSISLGYNAAAALKADGSVWMWGANAAGQLGDDTVIPKSSPVAVIGGHSFIAISIGGISAFGDFSLALKSDGSVWSWGVNNNGQLGDGTTVSKSSPVAVIGNHSFIAISGGGDYALALKSDGSAWAWGTGSAQLGNNTSGSKSSPVAVFGGHSFIAISGSDSTSYALKANGEVWAWGSSLYGQLGDNTTVAKSTPVAVVGGHSFIAIASGCSGYQAMALKANGEAWAWGRNIYGQLGDGTIINKSSPVAVIGGHSFIKIAGGQYHFLELKYDGTIWSHGWNNSPVLGIGLTGALNSRSSPTAVVGPHVFTGIDKGSAEYLLSVNPNDQINYGNGYFGDIYISGPWQIEYRG